MPNTQFYGQVWVDDYAKLSGCSAAPAPNPPALAQPFPLPRGHYYGLIGGPNESHGGINDAERRVVRIIQQRLIAKGYVPGISSINSPWADGVYEQATADAVTRFQQREMPGTTLFGQVWADDYAQLAR
ncbi:peptidoglycan-binding domain-containing protein [Corynebacterium sp. TAE3-ERU16]|uniref:peptidoglycan-binding domain-containing protein n=1 Tax=Corynebacterium sp. TAE3-ERU16 TaxID=2849493 RepID=UPI00351CD23F